MSILRFIRLCSLALTVIVSPSSFGWTKQNVNLYYPEIRDAKGNVVPLTPQVSKVFQYFEREAGLKFSVIYLPWKRAQLEVMKGNGIIYGFSKTSERLELYRFSLPVVHLPVWAISYGPENARLAELKDLKAKLVTASVGITHGIEYDRARNTIFTVQEDLLTYQERFRKLISRRSDIIFVPFANRVGREEIVQAINQKVVPGFNDPELSGRTFNVSLNPIFLDTIHFASSKTHQQYTMDKIDAAIERGAKNGSLSKLLRDY
ncbi:substrate-binding periplasmic protein [Undibacterium sp. Di24W]|uniref:substrate-binding periplasmic protein n=1 Tax=Undibacterium sp. Di24W TaxID=3413033 RepID=UPI003BF03BC7